ncbi:MAG: hypothetical protein ACOYZ7_07020 [Chloroflexota bacterium]
MLTTGRSSQRLYRNPGLLLLGLELERVETIELIGLLFEEVGLSRRFVRRVNVVFVQTNHTPTKKEIISMKKVLLLILVLALFLFTALPVLAGNQSGTPGPGEQPPGWSHVNPGGGGSDSPGSGVGPGTEA